MYRQITDLLELSDKIQEYLHLKRFHTNNNQEIFSRTTYINITIFKQINITKSSNNWRNNCIRWMWLHK